ncbi:MAG: aspartyl/asparaginyl beta-hydroxylase domain-containing protein [Vicinamibacterales bacterium]
MATTSRGILYGRLAGFQVDVARLREHYETMVARQPATPYHDNEANYVGWAVTSRDGSLSDGVKWIDPKSGGVPGRKATGICSGALLETMRLLEARPVTPYRVRIMKLVNDGAVMQWHTDSNNEWWRLHIPIITNASAFFEWKLAGGRVERVHLPADGSAWLVRVDVTHRAVNRSREPSERVHLLMGLSELPTVEQIGPPLIQLKNS